MFWLYVFQSFKIIQTDCPIQIFLTINGGQMHRKRHQQQPVYQSLAHKEQDKMVDKAVCACRKAQRRHQIRTFNCSGMLSGDYKPKYIVIL